MLLENGWIVGVKQVLSPHFDLRPEGEMPSLLVIHSISLPPSEFGGPISISSSPGHSMPMSIPILLVLYIYASRPIA